MGSVGNIKKGFSKHLRQHNAPHYFLAVSGGCDSMVLMDLFQKQKKSFSVLHVNYQLRGDSSQMDASLVRQACLIGDIPFYELNHDLSIDLAQGGNLQQLAREVRYHFFKSFLSKKPKALICLAHHKNDQEESFWMSMSRGGGLRAMAGMKVMEGSYFRPLLEFTKKELMAYAIQSKIEWREDASNKKNIYTRNIWRNILIPGLIDKHPTLSKSVELLQRGFAVQVAEDRKLTHKLIPSTPKDFELNLNTVATLNSNQWIELLDQLQIPKALALSILELAKGVNGKKIIIKSKDSPYQAVWKNEQGWLFECNNKDTMAIPSFEIALTKSVPKAFNKNEIYLDPEKITGEISVRKWKHGDRIHPIGIHGSKLVSDILKDAKIPFHKREDVWIIEDEEKPISLLGHVIDRRALAFKSPCILLKFQLNLAK
ncbi:MAG: tRNA lysidine(34) synthetase TilS [Crocinitomicaceae bacterium]